MQGGISGCLEFDAAWHEAVRLLEIERGVAEMIPYEPRYRGMSYEQACPVKTHTYYC